MASKIGLKLVSDQMLESGILWVLDTQMQDLTVSYQKRYHEQATDIRIKSLRVADNSEDSRFDCIFENVLKGS